MTDDHWIEIKRIAAQLTASMLDDHNGDPDDRETARAFEVIFAAIEAA